jgi:hypothetical protein
MSGKEAIAMAISGIVSVNGINLRSTAPTSGGKSAGAAGGGAKPAAKSTASQSSTASSASGTYEDADTNKDGVVTAIEQMTYDMKHPGAQTGSTVDVRV